MLGLPGVTLDFDFDQTMTETLQKFAKAVSRRSKEESSLDQELAEFNLVINNMSLLDDFLHFDIFLLEYDQVINVEGRTTNCSGGRVKHFMSKERREKILKKWDVHYRLLFIHQKKSVFAHYPRFIAIECDVKQSMSMERSLKIVKTWKAVLECEGE